ncbi:serine/threonine-protein kinase [Actinomadura vinacea]|uniref:serine/threonine-protein kinase n=1 Tax=Actinomadura vinacea TaxID=115336 RepID=UPI0031DB9F58
MGGSGPARPGGGERPGGERAHRARSAADGARDDGPRGRADRDHDAPVDAGPDEPGPARAAAARPRSGGRRPLTGDDPRRIGTYRLTERLGEGGQGVVYLGRDEDGGPVAVKLLRGGAGASQRARARFVKEAEAALQVTGRSTAQVLDADVTGDRPYIVSEYVEGPSLQRLVEERGPLPSERLERTALRTARSLAAIHKAGIVHRDFKPGNVLLGPDGAKVIDFGIARALDAAPLTTGPIGTPAYMAPEQIEDEPVGPPADVFAWAATMVYAGTGRPPFGTGPNAAVMRRVTSRRPDLGDLEGPLGDLVARCLDKNPAARPTARQVVRALRDGQEFAPKPRPKRIPRYRWRMMVALAAVMSTGFVLGILF